MFGYLTADILAFNSQQRRFYRSFYCGLCEKLAQRHRPLARLTLSYDFTFIGMLLCDVYQQEVTLNKKHCPIHPLTKIEVRYSPCFDFVSDMNLLMNYYQYLDDFHDDHNLLAGKKAQQWEAEIVKIQQQYPQKCQVIQKKMTLLAQYENDNVLIPDLPANCFGEIMAELCYEKQDEHSEVLKKFGFHLGRYIYLLDAVLDLKKDLKKGHYNPLITMDSSNFQTMLTLVLEEANFYYKELKLDKFCDLLDNIVYTGLWSKYDQQKILERKSLK